MKTKQAGFTLMELMVGMALMVLIMGGVAEMFTNLLNHGVQGSNIIDREQEARWALDMISQDLRFSSSFNTAAGTGAQLDFVKTDSNLTPVRVLYKLTDAGLGNGNQVLTRTVWIPATAGTSVTSQVGNPQRGIVRVGDFTVTVTAANKLVTQVDMTYQIRDAADQYPPIQVKTRVYPFNKVTMP